MTTSGQGTMDRRQFPTFDTLRFIAFLCVFMAHVPVDNIPVLCYFKKSGGTGVSFFFVLSGFLITYLLLYEKEKNSGTVNLKNFYVRRALRIWPLFYAMLLFAFVTPRLLAFLQLSSSGAGYTPDWLMSCLFLENYKMMLSGSSPNVSPLAVMWSLCIEEHFYILWGIAFYFTPSSKAPWIIVSALLVANLSRAGYSLFHLPFSDVFTNLDLFAYGAVPAYCLIKRNDVIEKLGRWPPHLKYIVAAVTIAYVLVSPHIHFPLQQYLDYCIFGCLFASVIFFTLPAANRLYVSDSHIFSRLGVYTYGLYLYHTICINFFLQTGKIFGVNTDSAPGAGLVVILSLSLTVAVSIASYHLFEYPFLALKKYFRN